MCTNIGKASGNASSQTASQTRASGNNETKYDNTGRYRIQGEYGKPESMSLSPNELWAYMAVADSKEGVAAQGRKVDDIIEYGGEAFAVQGKGRDRNLNVTHMATGMNLGTIKGGRKDAVDRIIKVVDDPKYKKQLTASRESFAKKVKSKANDETYRTWEAVIEAAEIRRKR